MLRGADTRTDKQKSNWLVQMKKYTEHQIQKSVMTWASYIPELRLLFAIPNGGFRTKSEAGRFKAEGVKAGVPDLFLPVARHQYHGLFLEMKTVHGKVRPNQREWHEKLIEQGYKVSVCHSFDEAQKTLTQYIS